MLSKAIISLLLLIVTNTAVAFEGWEHKRLGDLSYYLAVEIFCDAVNKGTDTRECAKASNGRYELHDKFYSEIIYGERLHLNKNNDNGKKPSDYISYGDIVMCVDYFLTIEKMMAGREHHVIQGQKDGAKVATSDQKFVHSDGLFPSKINDLSFSVPKRCDPRYRNFEGARAAHVNHAHFQVELLVAQRMSHLSALTMVALEKNLFSGLAANAISDHYLQDSFAPGHITTLRSRLTDTTSNAHHDYNNQYGWEADVDLTRMNQLTNVADQGISLGLLDEIFNKLNGKGSTGTRLDYDSAARKYFLFSGRNEDKLCGGEESPEIINNAARIDDLKNFFGNKNGTAKVRMKGDMRLWCVAQDKQRLVMLWAEVRSIFDVLETWHGTNQKQRVAGAHSMYFKDSFSEGSNWKWEYTAADAHESFWGTDSSRIEASFSAVKYNIPFQDKREMGDHVTPREWVSYKGLDRLWGASYGIDNMTFGDSQNRKILTVGTYLFGKSSKSWVSENHHFWGGIQAYSGFGPDGLALTSRYAFVFPATETAFSVQLRALRLSRRDLPAVWKPTIGWRMDVGFTSFMTTYLQFGRDFALQKDNGIRSGWSIGAGIQLVAPTCRIPLIKKLSACD
jgi:hypothetical protein